MKRTIVIFAASALLLGAALAYAGSQKTGGACTIDSDCAFEDYCNNGVCTKKKEFDFGGSGKTGKPCQIDADCIGSGTCIEGKFGKKHCSGE